MVMKKRRRKTEGRKKKSERTMANPNEEQIEDKVHTEQETDESKRVCVLIGANKVLVKRTLSTVGRKVSKRESTKWNNTKPNTGNTQTAFTNPTNGRPPELP